MGSETVIAEKFLVPRLAADVVAASGRIYNEVAPSGAGLDPSGNPRLYVLVQWRSGVDTNGIGKYRTASQQVYTIQAIMQSRSYTDVEDAANQIDASLQGAKGDSVDGSVLGMRRRGPVKQLIERDGVFFVHLGGEYEVVVQAA